MATYRLLCSSLESVLCKGYWFVRKIQQRAAKLVPELRNLLYEERLKQLNIAIAIFSLLPKTEGRFDRDIQNLKKQYQVTFSHYHQ